MRSTLLLLVAAVALGAYAYFVESERPTRMEIESAKDSVFAIESSDLVELDVTDSSGERTLLRKTDGTWRLTDPVQVDADAIEVSGITSGVESLEIERVVAELPVVLASFGLADPRIVIAFKAEGDTEFTRLLLGDDTATGGDMYAMTSNDPRVFLVAAYLETSFDRATFDLRDKAILDFDTDEVDRIDITAPSHTVALVKTNEDDAWRLQEPWSTRGDARITDALVTRLVTGRMQAIVATDTAELDAFGLEAPRLTAVVGTGSTRATLLVGDATDDGTVYARDAARPLVFTVEESLVDELMRPPDVYRQKDLFTFRSFNATRIEIAQPDSTLVLEKSDGDPPEWRRLEPAPGQVGQPQVTALLSALSGLRADSFADADAGVRSSSPIATVTVRFGDDQEERVVFDRVADEVHATVADDSSAGIIDAAAFDAALADASALAGDAP